MHDIPILSVAQDSLELVVDARAELGEGPRWDAEGAVLWWVDILGGAIHRFDPATGRDGSLVIGGLVGAVAPRAGGGLVAALDDRVAAVDPETGAQAALVRFPPDDALRSNDAAVDPAGRLWVDRMARDAAEGAGSLVRVDPDGSVHTVLDGLTIPNGMDWSPDGRTMYFVESISGEVRAFAFDHATGEIGEGRTFVRLPGEGLPDGLTVDAEGCLWVAQWGAGRVVRISPDGAILGAVEIPVSQTTCCAFGGDDLGDLYITSARERFGPDDDAREPQAGGLWRCRPGVRGRPSTPFAG